MVHRDAIHQQQPSAMECIFEIEKKIKKFIFFNKIIFVILTISCGNER